MSLSLHRGKLWAGFPSTAEVSLDRLIKALLAADSSLRGHMAEGGASIRRAAGLLTSPPGDESANDQEGESEQQEVNPPP